MWTCATRAVTLHGTRQECKENLKMDPETNDESGESTDQDTPEQTEEAPQFKLRDLRPEKDPIGAGGKRSPSAGSGRFLR
jgi:hypothetical protein